MNLVISGPIDHELRTKITALVEPKRSFAIHTSAWRFEEVAVSKRVRSRTADLCALRHVDHAFVSPHQSFARFRLLAIDMDSTLIDIECIDELAHIAGVKQEVRAITQAAMQGRILDFAASVRQRVQLLKGLSASALAEVYEKRLNLTSGARELIASAKAAKMNTLLVSGGFTYFTERLKAELGFEATYANELEIIDDRLTGRLIEPIFDAASKAEIVAKTLNLLGATSEGALVIGDGANDIPMMSLAETSVAFHAKAAVRIAANAQIDFGGLGVVLDYYNSSTD